MARQPTSPVAPAASPLAQAAACVEPHVGPRGRWHARAALTPEQRAARRRQRRLLLGGIVLATLAMTGLWRWTPLAEYLSISALMNMGYALKALPYAAFAVVGCYVLGGLLSVPVTLLIAVTGLVFGALEGGIYALVGTMTSALVTYAAGYWLGRDTVRRLAGRRINALSERIARQGVLAMVVLRVLPVAPFTLVNVMAGASHIRLRDYLVGTFLGMAPGIVLIVVFARQLARALQHPDATSTALVIAAGLAMMLLAWGIQRAVDAFSRARERSAASAAETAVQGCQPSPPAASGHGRPV